MTKAIMTVASILTAAALFLPCFSFGEVQAERGNRTASPGRPATLNVKPLTNGSESALEMRVRANRDTDEEDFLVEVRGGTANWSEVFGTISFFPPAKAGETRTFVLPVPARVERGELELQFALLSAAQNSDLTSSSIEVIEARLVLVGD